MTILQPISWVAAAIGVCLAALYYALNLRETTRNRRATLSMNIMQSFLSEEGTLRFQDIMGMTWSGLEDYKKKYDNAVNPVNFAKRAAFWNTCEVIGFQYRTGILDIQTIYNVGGQWIQLAWRKFKPIIEEYRRWEWPSDRYENFEYLANVLHKMQKDRDAEYDKKTDVLFSTIPVK